MDTNFNTSQQQPSTKKVFENKVSIRRQKNQQEIGRRRLLNTLASAQINSEIPLDYYHLVHSDSDLQKLDTLKGHLRSANIGMAENALRMIRLILVQSEDPLMIQHIIDRGMLRPILEHAADEGHAEAQKLACWLLACLCSGDNYMTQQLIDHNLLFVLGKCLNVKSIATIEQVIWALANISGDVDEHRHAIMNSPVIMDKLVEVLEINSQRLAKVLCWLFGNLCKTRETPNCKIFKKLLPGISYLLKNHDLDEQDMQDLAKCISVLTLKSQQARLDFRNLNVLHFIYQRLTFRVVKSETTITLLFRIIGNLIASNSVKVINYALECGFVNLSLQYLEHQSINILKQICWIYANLAAGTVSHAQIIFKNQSLCAQFVEMLKHSSQGVKKQVGWIFSNICQILHPELVYNFYKTNNIIKYFINFLYYPEDLKAIEIGLQGIKMVLTMSAHFSVNGINPMLDENYSEIAPRVVGLRESLKDSKLIHSCSQLVRDFDLEEEYQQEEGIKTIEY